MRQTVILPDKYENIFLNEAEKSGLIKSLYSPADELYPPKVLEEAKVYYRDMLNGMNNERQNIFRILMLFDDIILSSMTKDYDYDKLIGTGLFSLFYFEDLYDSDPIHQDGHIEYAIHLKPAILPVYEKSIISYFPVGQAKDGFTNFVSDLYDWILLNQKSPIKHRDFIELNKNHFNTRNGGSFNRLRQLYKNPPDMLTEKGRFFTDIALQLQILYESLCWKLEISSTKDAAILDCEFQLANIGCGERSNDVIQGMEAYRILRVECGKIIGTLPEVNSIQEVLQIKEKRSHDLHNLRQELLRLEYEIRNGNSQRTIELAAKDISKASRALSHGNVVSRVKKWTNFFSIPIATASLFLENPQMMIGAGAISVLGNTLTFMEDTIRDKNRWLEIVI